MKSYSIKLFNFKNAPVSLSIWFFLLFTFIPSFTAIFVVFLSILIHEMAHAWMADKKGYTIYGITIDIFSGSASMSSNIHDRDSIPITAAGPLSTLALCVIGYLMKTYIGDYHQIYYYLYIVNLYLFIFNILPIYPMDGGQITRSIANLSRNRYESRRIVSWVSLISSILLVIVSSIIMQIFMIIYGFYFCYLSLKELKIL